MVDVCPIDACERRMIESGFKLLRPLAVPRYKPFEAEPGARRLAIIDVETTGTDASSDEIVELAIVAASYEVGGSILGIHDCFVAQRDPGRPIPAAVSTLTGITDADVVGKSIQQDEVAMILADPALVIAHNANFDRRFLERQWPDLFQGLPFACSMEDVDWRAQGIESSKLAYIAAEYGFHFGKHRANADCLAVLEILGRPAARSTGTILGEILASARLGRRRLRALEAPYDVKDDLRRRGYRWFPGCDGQPRCWFIDLRSEADVVSEYAYLAALSSEIRPHVRVIDAYDRFSIRADAV